MIFFTSFLELIIQAELTDDCSSDYYHIVSNLGRVVNTTAVLPPSPTPLFPPLCPFCTLLLAKIGVPGDLLHEFLGFDNPSRAHGRELMRQHCVFVIAHTGPRVFLPVHLLEHLGYDEGHFRQEIRSGMATAGSFVFGSVAEPADYAADRYLSHW